MTPAKIYADFRKHQYANPIRLPLPEKIDPQYKRIRANQWKLVDWERDGDLDVIVGIGVWDDYGWDDAWDEKGNWKNGPLHGFVYLVDRKKEMILSGGFNVYPRDVEEVLYLHPKVLEAAVIGLPDAFLGESVKAFIVPRDGTPPTPDEIIEFCREHLVAYKVPKYVECRASLPKTLIGKVLRRALREEEQRRIVSP